jgi:chaperonin GroES
MKLEPLGNRVVIRRAEKEDKTPSGIHLPENAKQKPVRGLVVAVGPGKSWENGNVGQMSVKVGNEVLLPNFGGTEIEIDGEKLLILNEDDLLAVFQ